MSRVLLIFGNPGNGKSRLTGTLTSQHGFRALSVDAIYVAFVEAIFPNLFLPDLGNFIPQHYECIFKIDPGRLRHWWSHLATLIANASDEDPNVAVEGYQLYDCKNLIEELLAQRGRRVFQIKAERFTYTLEPGLQELAAKDIAALGL